MNEKKEIKMPDSLIVANAKSELWQTIQNYQFPLYLWELIVNNLYLEIKSRYQQQLTKDQSEYDLMLAESKKQEEQQNEDTCEC